MAESSSRKNLKRSFLEDEDSNKQPPEKRVRFPKGKKSKPEQLLEEEALARQQVRDAAKERAQIRAQIRNQNTAQLFVNDDDDADQAEETYENDENRTEDGIQIEAFSLEREKEEGYFDADGNFVEYVREKEVKDAWLDSIEKNPMYIGRSAANDTEKDEDSGDDKPAAEELSQEDIGRMKRRIANVLEPGETVLRALRRLKGNSNNRKEKMTSETKVIFDQLTEDADKLVQNGDYNVYHEQQEVFEREAEGYERLAQARANGNGNTESCDMFADDDEDTPIPSSSLPSGSISDTQLNPVTTATESGGHTNNGSDYVFDESSGYYYSSSLGYYYDPNTGLYCSAATNKWYKYDEEKKEYEEVVSEEV